MSSKPVDSVLFQRMQNILASDPDASLISKAAACAKVAADWEEYERLRTRPEMPSEPIPMLLWCPECGDRHIDRGEFATKPHETHACQNCGMVWKPAKVPTVGVQFLPGYHGGTHEIPVKE